MIPRPRMSRTGRVRQRLVATAVVLSAAGLATAGDRLVFERAAILDERSASTALPEAPANEGLRLHVFLTGSMTIPAWSAWVGGRGDLAMDQPAYLIEHPRFGRLMFEAGHHPDIARDPGEHLGWIHYAGLMPMSQRAGQDARTQLRENGIAPESVLAIIPSHFHPEHVGAVEEFPDATLIADRREVDHAMKSPDYNYVPREYDHVQRWQTVDFEGTPPFGPFPGSFDLFGDGSVVVISSPGHTPGHVSLFVRLPGRPVLLAGDVAWCEKNLESRSIGLPFVSSDGQAARRALGQLIRFRRENPDVIVVPGHDIGPLRRAEHPAVILHGTASAVPRAPAGPNRG